MGELIKQEPVKGQDLLAETRAIEAIAKYVVKSGLFGVSRPDEAVALMLLARAEGLHPMRAVQQYHIVKGRPVMRADAMLARFQAAGGKVRWIERSDTAVEAEFEHPAGGKVRVRWALEDAKRAGLLDKKNRDGSPNMWEKYPRQMLTARVISEGIRTIYPGVITGIYTPEEVYDFEEPEERPGPRVVKAEVVEVEPEEKQEAPSPEPPRKKEVPRVIKAPAKREVAENPWAQIGELLEALKIDPGEAILIARVITGKQVETAKDLSAKEAAGMADYLAMIHDHEALQGIPPSLRGRFLVELAETGSLPGRSAIKEEFEAWRSTHVPDMRDVDEEEAEVDAEGGESVE